MAVISITLTMVPTIIIEETEMIFFMKIGIMTAGVMTMITDGTVTEMGNGTPLDTSLVKGHFL